MDNWKENTTGSLRDSDKFIEMHKKYGYALRAGDKIIADYDIIRGSGPYVTTGGVKGPAMLEEITQLLWKSDSNMDSSLEVRLVDKEKISLNAYSVVEGEFPLDLYHCKEIFKEDRGALRSSKFFDDVTIQYNAVDHRLGPSDGKLVTVPDPSSSIAARYYRPILNDAVYYVLEKNEG